jgi:MYXO-CTERM domain-containing protein
VFGPGEPTRLLRIVPYPPSSVLVLQDTNAAKHDVTHVAIVDLDGTVTAWVSVDGGAEPAAAPFDVGRGMLVYRRYDGAPTTQSQRVEVRLYGPRADGAACGVAADCASPFCELGFCCPTACMGDCHTGTCLVPDGGTDAGAGGGAGGGSASGGGAAGGIAAGGGGGGSPARGPLALRVGCGCTVEADGPALLLLLCVAVVRRRKFSAASRR